MCEDTCPELCCLIHEAYFKGKKYIDMGIEIYVCYFAVIDVLERPRGHFAIVTCSIFRAADIVVGVTETAVRTDRHARAVWRNGSSLTSWVITANLVHTIACAKCRFTR